MRISPGPGSPTWTGSIVRTSGPPACEMRTALSLIGVLLMGDVARASPDASIAAIVPASRPTRIAAMSLTPRLALMLSLPPLLWAGTAVVGLCAPPRRPPLLLAPLPWTLPFALLLRIARPARALLQDLAPLRAR